VAGFDHGAMATDGGECFSGSGALVRRTTERTVSHHQPG
jgi:hypothetical protein